jgi:hypothetical protein
VLLGALVLLGAAATLGGCGRRVTQLGSLERVMHLRVVSRTPGAMVFRDGKAVGRTPMTSRLRYRLVEEEVVDVDQGVGGGLALAAAGGLALLGYHVHQLGQEGLFSFGEEDNSSPTLSVLGIVGIVASVIMAGAGIYLLATVKKRYKRSTPASTKIEVIAKGTKPQRRYVSLGASAPTHRELSFTFGHVAPMSITLDRDPGDEPMLTPLLKMRAVEPSRDSGERYCIAALLRVCASRGAHSLPSAALRSLLMAFATELARAKIDVREAGTQVELDVRKHRSRCALALRLRRSGKKRSLPHRTVRSSCNAIDLLRNVRAAARGVARTLAAQPISADRRASRPGI